MTIVVLGSVAFERSQRDLVVLSVAYEYVRDPTAIGLQVGELRTRST